jgi:K+-transporting ATPase c subunit
MLEIGSGQGCDFLPPVIRRKIQVVGADKIADAAALVRFLNSRPEAVELERRRSGSSSSTGAHWAADRRRCDPRRRPAHKTPSQGNTVTPAERMAASTISSFPVMRLPESRV